MILPENDGEMVVWSGVRWVSVEVSVCVCLSKEKRKKMKGRKRWPAKREKRDRVKMSGGGLLG